MSDVPTYGWRRQFFRHKKRCVTCGRSIHTGIVNIHLYEQSRTDPRVKAMCTTCYASDEPLSLFEVKDPNQHWYEGVDDEQ